MKNLFLSALLLAGAGMAFSSCNNGAYDADPLTNNSGISNPMNTNNGSSTALGHIKGKFNSNDKDFTNAHYMDLIGKSLTGAIGTSPTDIQVLSILINPYDGLKIYRVNDTASDLTFAYSIGSGPSQVVYGVVTKGHMNVEVTDDSNNQIKGTFDGVAYNINDNNDSLVVTDGSFYLPKQ